jgi:acyl carrier protein
MPVLSPAPAALDLPAAAPPPEAQIAAYVWARVRATGWTGPMDPAAAGELTLDQAGLDSLELMELIIAIEDHFSITIHDGPLLGSDTLKDLCRMVASARRA